MSNFFDGGMHLAPPWSDAILAEIKECLCALISFPTSRGGERAAADCLSHWLDRPGIVTQIFEPAPGRASLVAKVAGNTGRTVLLLTHLDTAPPDEGGAWHFPSGQATCNHGRIYGRGALDCKGPAAVGCAILNALANAPFPHDTVLLAATAGEEEGGRLGTQWLLENTDVFDEVSLVLGEGGGAPVKMDGKLLFTYGTGELEEDDGEFADNTAPARAKPLDFYSDETLKYIEWLRQNTPGRQVPESVFFQGVGACLDRYAAAGYAPSPALEDAARRAIAELFPGCGLLPYIAPGYSDLRFFRARGIAAAGFFPLHPNNALRGIHGADEYISEASLQVAYCALLRLLELLGTP